MTEACWSFPTTNTDHAETPIEAYEDVVPVLDFLCTLLHRTRATLRIWDPFFCHGTMVQRLAELGFTSVTNENEDAYHVIAEKREPEHDVLLTNPPFSGDHMQRIIEYCISPKRRDLFWILLIPQYVDKKPFFMEYKRLSEPERLPLYIGPTASPYVFTIPKNVSEVIGTEEEKRQTTIFQCIWFVHVGSHKEKLLTWWKETQNSERLLCTAAEELPELADKSSARMTPAERRWKKKMRNSGVTAQFVPRNSGRGNPSKKRKTNRKSNTRKKRPRI